MATDGLHGFASTAVPTSGAWSNADRLRMSEKGETPEQWDAARRLSLARLDRFQNAVRRGLANAARFLLPALLLVSLSISGCASGLRPPTAVAAASKETCLLLTTATGSGSAFACRWGGRVGVMTAWHCVRRGTHSAMVAGGGTSQRITFAQVGESDVGWCQMAVPAGWRVLDTAEPVADEKCEAWGYGNKLLQMRRGSIDEIGYDTEDEDQAAGTYLRMSCGLEFGMSGGPVLNCSGRAVAVVVLGRIEREWSIDFEGKTISQVEFVRMIAVDIPDPGAT